MIKADIDRSADIIAPPPRLSISQWADRYAYLSSDSAEPGKFRLSRMPHEAAMLDDPADPTVREVFWMMASQGGGKTQCLILICEFIIHQLHKSIIMVRDTRDRAVEWMRDKFLPAVAATPCMSGLLVETRKRGSESTMLSRRYPGGVMKVIGAKSPGAFRSTSAANVFCDEIDAYVVGKEGDPCSLADRATITFSDAWKIKCSTTTLANFSRIHDGFKSGDQQLYFLPCPVCGGYQDLKPERMKFSFTAEEYARFDLNCNPNYYIWELGAFPIRDTKRTIYICEHCQRGWTDTQRIQSYMSGHADNPPVRPALFQDKELRAEWRATAPFTGIRSRDLNGMYITIGLKKDYANYLHMFAETFLAAVAGGRETLMVWTNIFANKPFEDASEKTDWKFLKERAEDYRLETNEGKVFLPAQVCWIAFGADVHPDRVELLFYGWGDKQEAWALEHHVIHCDFDMPEGQERVWEYLSNKRFTHPVLGDMAWSAGAIDSGKQTKVQAVYRFAAKHKLSNIWSCKGFDEALGAVYEAKTEKVHGGKRLNFNTDYLKNLIFDRLRNRDPGPNYIHFPKERGTNFGLHFYQQLCSEKRIVVKAPKGGFKTQWVKLTSATRNEILDMTVYAFGVFEVCRQVEAIARKWKQIQEKLKEQNIPVPVEGKREVYAVESAKMDEVKPRIPDRRGPPMRRRVRIGSPFAGPGWRRF